MYNKTDVILQQMRDAKCTIPDCGKKAFMFVDCMGLLLPFCDTHFNKILKVSPKWQKIANKVEKALRNSDGTMVKIDTWKEMEKRLKPDFLAVATQGLEFTKGKCLYCNDKAVLVGTAFTPLCEDHADFPRMVFKVVIK